MGKIFRGEKIIRYATEYVWCRIAPDMKKQSPRTIRKWILAFLITTAPAVGLGQGRVVINEYMPWPGSACGTTAEFVELMNFGPGPINIGCYILTDGDHTITIPEGTILQPGGFYVIGGQDSIEAPCANLDSTIRVHLNWNKCDCTSSPIPTTGDGFLTDGGSANEQVVLLDPLLEIVDAVARSLPVEPNNTLTSQSPSGSNCVNSTFNLNLLNPDYETIGQSAGRGNSFARSTDGDCGWVKDPQQSAGATNNRGGETSNVQYNFYYLKATSCARDGKISVTVTAADYSNIFPMSFILAVDSNRNGQFDLNDQYITGTVSTPNSVTLDSLHPGTYRLTLASVQGCNLRTFPFTIASCSVVALPLKLRSFQAERKKGDVLFSWVLEETRFAERCILEGSVDGSAFQSLDTLLVPDRLSSLWQDQRTLPVASEIRFVRLQLISHLQEHSWSPIRLLESYTENVSDRIYPNPTSGQATLETESAVAGFGEIKILHAGGAVLRRWHPLFQKGPNLLLIDLRELPKGLYLIQLQIPTQQPIRFFRISKN